jgi:hypothetical protein
VYVLDMSDFPKYPWADNDCPKQLYKDRRNPVAVVSIIIMGGFGTHHSKPLRHAKYVAGSPKKPYEPWKRCEPKKSMMVGISYNGKSL